MFVDSAVVTFVGGKGGDGCVSFRREKYIPRGGPDGGDGGDGGSIILVSRSASFSLIDYKFKDIIKAERGFSGSGSNRTGKSGQDMTLTVPAGVLVKTYPEGKLLFDFTREDMEFIIVKGGRGGKGNSRFKTSVNQAPRQSTPGQPGETLQVTLELKLIAFAGLVGFPNAGKSTLISKISGARPKIADYPFTTLTPHLGVVYQDYESLVVADIPGIIEGAHTGEGMGLNFLKHIERNRTLIFLIDGSPYEPHTPLETLEILRDELKAYSSRLLKKKALVVVNKTDLIDTLEENTGSRPHPKRKEIAKLEKYCVKNNLNFMTISAVKETNLAQFKNKLFELYHGN